MADAERDPARFNVVPTPETHFSWLRTRMSVERTLMSAVRTATSLIAFGFTLFQFLNQLNRMPGAGPTRHQDVPWYLGLTLIGAGVLGLLNGPLRVPEDARVALEPGLPADRRDRTDPLAHSDLPPVRPPGHGRPFRLLVRLGPDLMLEDKR